MVVYQDPTSSTTTLDFNCRPAGLDYVGDDWNDRISSRRLLSGTWQFFEHAGFGGARTIVGPGLLQLQFGRRSPVQYARTTRSRPSCASTTNRRETTPSVDFLANGAPFAMAAPPRVRSASAGRDPAPTTICNFISQRQSKTLCARRSVGSGRLCGAVTLLARRFCGASDHQPRGQTRTRVSMILPYQHWPEIEQWLSRCKTCAFPHWLQ